MQKTSTQSLLRILSDTLTEINRNMTSAEKFDAEKAFQVLRYCNAIIKSEYKDTYTTCFDVFSEEEIKAELEITCNRLRILVLSTVYALQQAENQLEASSKNPNLYQTVTKIQQNLNNIIGSLKNDPEQFGLSKEDILDLVSRDDKFSKAFSKKIQEATEEPDKKEIASRIYQPISSTDIGDTFTSFIENDLFRALIAGFLSVTSKKDFNDIDDYIMSKVRGDAKDVAFNYVSAMKEAEALKKSTSLSATSGEDDANQEFGSRLPSDEDTFKKATEAEVVEKTGSVYVDTLNSSLTNNMIDPGNAVNIALSYINSLTLPEIKLPIYQYGEGKKITSVIVKTGNIRELLLDADNYSNVTFFEDPEVGYLDALSTGLQSYNLDTLEVLPIFKENMGKFLLNNLRVPFKFDSTNNQITLKPGLRPIAGPALVECGLLFKSSDSAASGIGKRSILQAKKQAAELGDKASIMTTLSAASPDKFNLPKEQAIKNASEITDLFEMLVYLSTIITDFKALKAVDKIFDKLGDNKKFITVDLKKFKDALLTYKLIKPEDALNLPYQLFYNSNYDPLLQKLGATPKFKDIVNKITSLKSNMPSQILEAYSPFDVNEPKILEELGIDLTPLYNKFKETFDILVPEILSIIDFIIYYSQNNVKIRRRVGYETEKSAKGGKESNRLKFTQLSQDKINEILDIFDKYKKFGESIPKAHETTSFKFNLKVDLYGFFSYIELTSKKLKSMAVAGIGQSNENVNKLYDIVYENLDKLSMFSGDNGDWENSKLHEENLKEILDAATALITDPLLGPIVKEIFKYAPDRYKAVYDSLSRGKYRVEAPIKKEPETTIPGPSGEVISDFDFSNF